MRVGRVPALSRPFFDAAGFHSPDQACSNPSEERSLPTKVSCLTDTLLVRALRVISLPRCGRLAVRRRTVFDTTGVDDVDESTQTAQRRVAVVAMQKGMD